MASVVIQGDRFGLRSTTIGNLDGRNNMIALIVTIVAIATVGCATQADRQNEFNSKMSSVVARNKACNARAKADPDLQILKGKVELGSSQDQTLAHYGNTSTPTDQEKDALVKYSEIRSKCFQQTIKESRDIGMSESQLKLLADHDSQLQDALTSLYSGKVTYGDYAKARKVIAASSVSASHELIQKNAQEQEVRNQVASQQALQNFQNQQQLNLEQQRINAINNATLYGRRNNPINCTTTTYGMTADTTCR